MPASAMASQPLCMVQRPGQPKVDFLDEYSFTQVRKAKNAGVYSWGQG